MVDLGFPCCVSAMGCCGLLVRCCFAVAYERLLGWCFVGGFLCGVVSLGRIACGGIFNVLVDCCFESWFRDGFE